jgi:cytosine/adenosine deaminase-related metal-dependent hydrolase
MDAVGRLAGAQRLASLLLDGVERTPRVVPGQRADLVVLQYDPPTPFEAANLAGHALFGWSSAGVRDTMCGGRFVVRDRAVQTVDVPRLHARARAAAARLWQRMEERS